MLLAACLEPSAEEYQAILLWGAPPARCRVAARPRGGAVEVESLTGAPSVARAESWERGTEEAPASQAVLRPKLWFRFRLGGQPPARAREFSGQGTYYLLLRCGQWGYGAGQRGRVGAGARRGRGRRWGGRALDLGYCVPGSVSGPLPNVLCASCCVLCAQGHPDRQVCGAFLEARFLSVRSTPELCCLAKASRGVRSAIQVSGQPDDYSSTCKYDNMLAP